MHFHLSSCQLVLATTFLGFYIAPALATEATTEATTFQTLKARETDGIAPSGASGTGTAHPSAISGPAWPTGSGSFEAFVYENTTMVDKNATGKLVKIELSIEPTVEPDDPMFEDSS